MSKEEMSLKGSMDFASTVAFLGDFVKSFAEKTVCIEKGDEFIALKPTDAITFEIEAQRRKGKQKLSIELSWNEEMTPEASTYFTVSSREPEPASASAAPAPAPETVHDPVKKAAAGK
jgi:amphi-Trp domain-containing protein